MKNNKNVKIASEEKTRAVVMNIATQLGCQNELKEIFHKYDNLLRNCTNEVEANHIRMVALNEVNKLLEVNYNLKMATYNNVDIIDIS